MSRSTQLGPLDPIFDNQFQSGMVPQPQIGFASPTVTINVASGQDDPVVGGDVDFDVVFSENVSGFSGSGIILAGTALPLSASVSGSGTTYVVTVSGMTVTGTVLAYVAPAAATSDVTGLGNYASTSTDNQVDWILPVGGLVWEADASDVGSITATGNQVTSIADLIGSNDLTKSASAGMTTGTRTLNGLNVLDCTTTGSTASAGDVLDIGTDSFVLAVVIDSDGGSNVVPLGKTDSTASSSGSYGFKLTPTQIIAMWNEAGINRDQTATTTATGPLLLLMCVNRQSTAVGGKNITLRSNRTTIASMAFTANPTGNVNTVWSYGIHVVAGTTFDGGWGQGQLYRRNTDFTLSELQTIETVIGTKWGL